MPVDAAVVVNLLGGIGLFLLGIHHLTEGLKGLSGDSLRRTLQRLISGRFSAVASGVILTVATQSSTATILTVIGFVGAGLVTLTQAIAVNMGATLGTTSTPWMVAILGLRVQIATAALPILGVGAFLWLIARGKMRSLGAVLAGFGLIFIGIDYLQSGMAGVSWNLEALAGKGFGAMWILAGIGIIMTIVMQSSSAAAATTLVALDAGSLTFEQGCAMIVGQSIGTAATTGLAVIGGGLTVRRAALAHIAYSLIVGVLAMLLLKPLTGAAEWVGSRLDEPQGVLALAAFSTIFKLGESLRSIRGSIPSCGSSFDSPEKAGSRPSRVSSQPWLERAGRSRSKLPGARPWRWPMVPWMPPVGGSRANPSSTSRPSKTSSRSSTSSNRSRWKPPIWARSAAASSGSATPSIISRSFRTT